MNQFNSFLPLLKSSRTPVTSLPFTGNSILFKKRFSLRATVKKNGDTEIINKR